MEKNYFKNRKKIYYKNIPVHDYILQILSQAFFINQTTFFYILSRFKVLREKFNILSITSLYNQWPLQDLIFKIFNKKDFITLFTSMHGGAHSMYKLYPCMDQN